MFRGLYWSIVTMSTVGFGDIAPSTPLGQVLAAMLMIVGYSVIAVPTGIVSAEVNSSLDGGAKTIVVITAGFKEVDEAGARLELAIAELCRGQGARLLGPNSLGLINTHHKLNAAFANFMPKVGGISVLSQSGALCSAILDWAASREVGLATLLSMGNKADLCETDFLAAFLEDEKTKVVAGYLESISNGEDFIRVAESVAAIKPVVILKARGPELDVSLDDTQHNLYFNQADGAVWVRQALLLSIFGRVATAVPSGLLA